METPAFATEPLEHSVDWAVTRDAFAPPPARKIFRGWDRAPVPALAPHSQGKIVWKTPSSRQNPGENGPDRTQLELLKEGVGPRKRSKVTGGKESIGNAPWDKNIASVSDLITGPSNHFTDVLEVLSQTPPPLTDSRMQYVPRKRTNTDHVITPKKPLRQTTLVGQGQRQYTLEVTEELAKGKGSKSRKSLRKSFRRTTIPNAASLNHEKGNSQGDPIGSQPVEAEKERTSKDEKIQPTEPKQARRSLRRSTRSARTSTPAVDPTVDTEDCDPTPSQDFIAGDEVYPAEISNIKNGQSQLHENATEVQNSDELPTKHGSQADVAESTTECHAPGLILADDKLLLMKEEQIGSTQAPEQGREVAFSAVVAKESEKVVFKKDSEQASLKSKPEQAEENTTTDTFQQDSTVGLLLPTVEPKSPAAVTTTISHSRTPLKTIHSEVATVIETVDATSHLDSINIAELDADSAIGNAITSVDDKEDCAVHADIVVDLPEDFSLNEEAADDSAIPPTATPAMFTYDDDDTNMLRSFLTRVQANKAANKVPKRKRSLPHSPLRIPLGNLDLNLSPSPAQSTRDIKLEETSPTKRSKRDNPLELVEGSENPEPQSCRRSGRTKIPLKASLGAPSFIPVRRLGQDPDTTVTLKRSEDKELAALTRVNTRKNKGGALSVPEILAKKTDEKDDPVMRQRLLKEVFEEKAEKGKKAKKGKGLSVVWAEELAQYQEITKGRVPVKKSEKAPEQSVVAVETAKGKLQVKKPEKPSEQPAVVAEEKKTAVRVGIRSKIALGMATNGTPAPKRKIRGRV